MEYIMSLMIIGCINVVAVCGMVLLTGYTGIFSMGHAGFMAVGAYTAAILYMYVHVPYIFAVILGGLAAAISSIVIGYPTLKLKLRGDYFAIATLGFGEIVKLVLSNTGSDTVFGGAMGIIGLPKLTGLAATLIFTIVSVYFLRSFIKSHYGRNCIAVQQQEVAAEMIGINTFKVKLTSLMISAFYAGIAGAMFAFYMTYVSPVTFNDVKSTDLTAAVVMGGINSISGPLAAGFFLVLLPEILRSLIEWRLVIYGLIFVVIMLFKPEGLFGYREISFRRKKDGMGKKVQILKRRQEKDERNRKRHTEHR